MGAAVLILGLVLFIGTHSVSIVSHPWRLFGSLLVWAGVDRASVKRRGQQPSVTAAPSALNDPIAIVVGLAIYALFVLGAHRWLFGVPAAMV